MPSPVNAVAGDEYDAAGPDSEYGALLDALGFSPVTADTIEERTGLTPQAVSSMLLILELRGDIEALPDAHCARRREGLNT